jgi:hypothetical protein
VSSLYALCLTCLSIESPVERLMESSVSEYRGFALKEYDNRQRNPPNGKKGKKGAKGKKGKQPFQLFPPYKGRPTYRYTSIGFLQSMHSAHSMTQSVSGAAEFTGADGTGMISGSDLTFDTGDIWSGTPLPGFKITSATVYDNAYLLKLSLDLAQDEATYTITDRNDMIQPIRLSDPFLPQMNVSFSRAFKVLGAMAYAGVNTSFGSYIMDVQDYTRPETYQPKSDVKIFGKSYGRYSGTPMLKRRQVGVGLDMGAMLVAYPYSKNIWMGVEWNGTVGVTPRDAYLNNSIGLVMHFK